MVTSSNLLVHSSSTFYLETNPSTSLRTSPKIQAVPNLREGIDAKHFLYRAFPRPKSAVRPELFRTLSDEQQARRYEFFLLKTRCRVGD